MDELLKMHIVRRRLVKTWLAGEATVHVRVRRERAGERTERYGFSWPAGLAQRTIGFGYGSQKVIKLSPCKVLHTECDSESSCFRLVRLKLSQPADERGWRVGVDTWSISNRRRLERRLF